MSTQRIYHGSGKQINWIVFLLTFLASALYFIQLDIAAPFQLVVAFLFVSLVPGFLVISKFRRLIYGIGLLEGVLLSFLVSYSMIPLYYLVGAALGLGFDELSLTLIGFVIFFIGIAFFKKNNSFLFEFRLSQVERVNWTLLLAIVCLKLIFLQDLVYGEETVELISIRKILFSDGLSFKGVLHRDNVYPTYILMPYQMYIALISKVAGVSHIYVYSKISSLYLIFAVIGLYLFVRLLSRSRAISEFGILIVLIILVVLPDSLSYPFSIHPIVRRGSFAAGVLLPIMLALSILINRKKSIANHLIGILIFAQFALLMTHALEAGLFLVFLFLVFLGNTLLKGRISSYSLTSFSSILVGTFIFKIIHSSLVDHIKKYNEIRDQSSLMEVVSGEGFLGKVIEIPTSSFDFLINYAGAWAPFIYGSIMLSFFGVILLRRNDRFKYFIICIPLITIVSSESLSLMLVSVSAPEMLNVSAYFGPLGVLMLALNLFSLCVLVHLLNRHTKFRAMRGMSVVIPVLSAFILFSLLYLGLNVLVMSSGFMVLSLVVTFCIFCFWGFSIRPHAWLMSTKEKILSSLTLVFLLTLLPSDNASQVLVPKGDREPIFKKVFEATDHEISFKDEEFYNELVKTLDPPLGLPFTVYSEWQNILKPNSRVIFDPSEVFSLPVFFNIYVYNIGSHLLSTDIEYWKKYVKRESKGIEVPIYNDLPEFAGFEREFLRINKIRYILSSPKYARQLHDKLKGINSIELIYDKNGYKIFLIHQI